jgi:hypothetical protein
MWGNPTADVEARLAVSASQPLRGLPRSVDVKGKAPVVIEVLVADKAGDIDIVVADPQGRELARANPLRVLPEKPPLRRYWGDLHGQSGETIGMRTAEEYFAYARDAAFIDIVGHQGNDFQITDAFWRELNALFAEFDKPGKFVCLPGYEWSGNTGMGGDRNVFYRREGGPIRRSSHILVEGQTSTEAVYTAAELFDVLKGEDARVIAHVGGRYADIKMAHDARLERTVEVHSSWGTFEWLLHDAFDMGYRVGVVCHSDDHKGRPGATRPGASTFGAIGGLSCYFMPELTRDAVFEALRTRKHYGTTGTRIFIDLRGTFNQDVLRFDEDPLIEANDGVRTREVAMGDIVRAGSAPMKLAAEVIGTAPVERVDVFEGKRLVKTVRPFAAADLGRRVRVLWQGAEYRGRGRETMWKGALKVDGNRIVRFAPVNFLNPERKVGEKVRGAELQWTSVTTGNLAGIDLWLESADKGRLSVETNIVSKAVELTDLREQVVSGDGGGLGRQVSIYRLPEEDWSRRAVVEHTVAHTGSADLPVFIRVTQADGHQAWTSPIYLIA